MRHDGGIYAGNGKGKGRSGIHRQRMRHVPVCAESGGRLSVYAQGIRDGIITPQRLDEAVTRILALKAALGLHRKTLNISEEEAEKVVGCPEHRQWAAEVADKGITLVKEEKGVLPITPEKYKRILLYRIEPMGEGYSIYKVSPVIEQLKQKLIAEGFEVDEFVPQPYGEGFTTKYKDMVSGYDLMLYVANLATRVIRPL